MTSHSCHRAADVETGLPALRCAAGLRGVWGGRSRDAEGAGAFVTVWDTFESLMAVLGGHLERSTLLPAEARSTIATRDISHWEALDLPAGALADPAILRLARSTVACHAEATYFGYIRDEVWPRLTDVPGHAGAFVGRQMAGDSAAPMLSMSLWRSLAELEASGAPAARSSRARRWDRHLRRVELYEVYAARVDAEAAAQEGPLPLSARVFAQESW